MIIRNCGASKSADVYELRVNRFPCLRDIETWKSRHRHVFFRVSGHLPGVHTLLSLSHCYRSTKDLLKAVNGYLSSPSIPLPNDLVEVIEAYLDKHHDDLPSERLHEELVAIWERSVKETPTSHAGWLAVLRRLLPALSSAAYLTEWWDRVHEPIIDHLADDKVLAGEAWANTLAVLTCDHIEQGGTNQLAIRLLQTWMQNVELASREDNSAVLLKAKIIRGGLLSYGKKRPKVR